MTGDTSWSESERAALKAMLGEGRSLDHCAKVLKRPRGSIAGKMHREGWYVGNVRSPGRVHAAPRPRPKRGVEDKYRRFSVEFDQMTMDEIVAFAEREDVSRAEAVRLLVEWGLEAVGDSDV